MHFSTSAFGCVSFTATASALSISQSARTDLLALICLQNCVPTARLLGTPLKSRDPLTPFLKSSFKKPLPGQGQGWCGGVLQEGRQEEKGGPSGRGHWGRVCGPAHRSRREEAARARHGTRVQSESRRSCVSLWVFGILVLRMDDARGRIVGVVHQRLKDNG
jgi:hypothetical protein